MARALSDYHGCIRGGRSSFEKEMESEINLEITLKRPPKGVGFCLQKGKSEKIEYQVSKGTDIKFLFSVRVREGKNEKPNFLGAYTQGKPTERFVYICIGQYAGQENTDGARRAKIHLSGITWQQVLQAISKEKGKLVASYEAADKDGRPSCASVPLVGNGWDVA